VTAPEPGYSFGPAEPGGVLLGLRSGQWLLLLIAGGALLVVLNHPGWLTFAGSAVVIASCLLGAFHRFRGRTADEYGGIWANAGYQRLTGQHTYRGGTLLRPHPAIPASSAVAAAWSAVQPPGLLGAMRFLTLQTLDGTEQVVVAHDPTDATYTAVLACQGQTLALLEAGEQARRIEAYGRLLAALCREDGLIAAVQVLERTVADSGDPLHRDWHLRGQQGNGWAAAAYEQTLASAGPSGLRHETYVAIAVDARRGSRDIAAAGGGGTGAAAVAYREASRVAEDLRGCGVQVLGLLPPRGLGYVISTAYDPASTAILDRRGGAPNDAAGGDHGLPSGVDIAAAWPSRAVADWDHYRTDSAFHASYWVLHWPQRTVPAAFLTPLLLHATVTRSVGLLYEPRSPRRAQRDVAIGQSKTEGEAGMRDRLRLRARQRYAAVADELDRREAELVAGHGMHRLRAVITVSAATLDELRDAQAETEILAQRSMLEIKPLYAEHDQGFVLGALPLARRPR
jgi:hypothetical protein